MGPIFLLILFFAGAFRRNGRITFLAVFLAADVAVHQYTAKADKQRNGKDDDRNAVVLLPRAFPPMVEVIMLGIRATSEIQSQSRMRRVVSPTA